MSASPGVNPCETRKFIQQRERIRVVGSLDARFTRWPLMRRAVDQTKSSSGSRASIDVSQLDFQIVFVTSVMNTDARKL